MDSPRPRGPVQFCCPECQQAVSSMRHTHTDVLLEDDERIVAEVLNAATVVGFKPEALPEVAKVVASPRAVEAAAAAAAARPATARAVVEAPRAPAVARALTVRNRSRPTALTPASLPRQPPRTLRADPCVANTCMVSASAATNAHITTVNLRRP